MERNRKKLNTLKMVALGATFLGISSLEAQSLRDSNQDFIKSRAPASVDLNSYNTICVNQATQMDSKTDFKNFASDCFDSVLGMASAHQITHSDDGRFTIAASDNIVLVKNSSLTGTEVQFIQGLNPSITQIEAVAIDTTRNEVFVLDNLGGSARQILVYGLGSMGKQDPLRQIDHASLSGASDIAIDAIAGKIYATFPSTKEIKVYGIEATKHGGSLVRFQQSPIAIMDVSSAPINEPSSLTIDMSSNSLFLSSADADKIMRFSLQNFFDQGKVFDLSSFGIQKAGALGVGADSKLEILDAASGQLHLIELSQLQ